MANPCFSVILSQKSANVAHYNKGTKETTKEDFPMSAINIKALRRKPQGLSFI